MKCIMFDTHAYDREAFTAASAAYGYDIVYAEPRLTRDTAGMAWGFPVVCSIVNDRVDAQAIAVLQASVVRLLALRSADVNHVDLRAAAETTLTSIRAFERGDVLRYEVRAEAAGR